MSSLSFSFQKRAGGPPFKSPTAFQLRALVLDYLCHQCYTNTARAFLQDSAVKELDADGDEVISLSPIASPSSLLPNHDSGEPSQQADILTNVRQRREIRELILAGRVDDATELMNKHFPAVLSHSAPVEALQPTEGDGERFTYESETSMNTSHLLLNLRVQAFIEACRTRPLDTPSDAGRSESSGTQRAITDALTGVSNAHPDPRSIGRGSNAEHPHHGDITPSRLSSLLLKGQKLYGLATALPSSKEKEVYQKELVNVGGLLAYPVPEDSPVSKYLSYERRVALADQINRAILYRSGQSPISNIELLTRYTTALWQSARSHGVKVRSGACIPPVHSKPPALASGTKPEDPGNEDVPAFDLAQFLDYKP